jgi:hypothetical protein
MISLGYDPLIEHLHRRRKENIQISLAGFPSDDLREEGFSCSRIPDQDDVGLSLPKTPSEL